MFVQFVINGLITGILYSLLAIGFALVYNTTHIFHIAAAGFYVFAAYMFWWFAQSMGILPACILSLTATAILSVLIDLSVYRPLQKKNSSLNSILVASIGIMTILVNLLAMFFGNESKLFSGEVQTMEFGNIFLTQTQITQVVCGGLVLILFLVFVKKTSLGIQLLALNSDNELFVALGYNEGKTRTFVFILSGLFIGLSSMLNVYDVGMDPNMGMNILINAMVAMIIGGIGRLDMCIAGGLLLGLLQSLIIYQFSSTWQTGITFLALLILLFFRPQGISGFKRRTV